MSFEYFFFRKNEYFTLPMLESSHVVMQDIEDIQFFGMNMPFISSSEAKKCIFHEWRSHE